MKDKSGHSMLIHIENENEHFRSQLLKLKGTVSGIKLPLN